jgi:hypothetical protein
MPAWDENYAWLSRFVFLPRFLLRIGLNALAGAEEGYDERAMQTWPTTLSSMGSYTEPLRRRVKTGTRPERILGTYCSGRELILFEALPQKQELRLPPRLSTAVLPGFRGVAAQTGACRQRAIPNPTAALESTSNGQWSAADMLECGAAVESPREMQGDLAHSSPSPDWCPPISHLSCYNSPQRTGS